MRIIVLAIAVMGCADPAASVRPARVASNAAADALAIAQRLEIARIRMVASKGMLACTQGDTLCRTGAVEAAFGAEQSRIDAIQKAIVTQNDVAAALIGFDGCQGPGIQACRANNVARLAPLAPELARLIEQVKGAQTP